MNLLLTTIGPSGHPIYNKPMGFAPFLIGGIILGCILFYIHTPHPNLSKQDKKDILTGWFWLIITGLFIFSILKWIVALFQKNN